MKKNNIDKDKKSLDRRQFLGRSLTIAGGATVAAMGVATNAFGAWPPSATPKYKGRSQTKDAYEMYTHSEYWSEEDVTWWEGRRVGGIAIGVIQLSANIPMIPGNMGNASTFNFPLMYEPMEVTGDMVVSTKRRTGSAQALGGSRPQVGDAGSPCHLRQLRVLCQLPE